MDHYDKIVNILDRPYFKNLETMGIDKEHYNEIFERLYNKKLDIIITQETSFLKEKDKNRKLIYYETSYGGWRKQEYNDDGQVIYYEDSNGYWYKYEYDEYGKMNYYEDSNGITIS